MIIEDLTPEYESLYCVCMEDWSEEMAEAGDHKEKWYCRMKDRGLRVKLAKDDHGEVGGMIQYLPIEQSFVDGRDLYFVLCIFVHGHKKGRGDFSKRGMGQALLKAAEEDARGLGARGVVVWGLIIPAFMRASWFKRQGYIKVDRMGIQALLWKPFSDDAVPPRWIHQKKKPELITGKVTVSGFINGWCPAQNIAFERAKRAAGEFPNQVEFIQYDTHERETFLNWGISDALFVDKKAVWTGPPPSYEKIKRIIEKRVKNLK
ncbi:MAG: GNAT family N-acetyltransferase [Syntrophomonadaceae bacterium]